VLSPSTPSAPPGIRVVPGVPFTIVRRWRSRGAASRVALAIVTDVAILAFCFGGIVPGLGSHLFRLQGPISVLIVLIIVSAGSQALRLTFDALAQVVNTTSLVVDGGQLHVRHGPLAWRWGATVRIDRVEQLLWSETGHGTTTGLRSAVLSADCDGKRVPLLGPIPLEEAKYIERVLDEHLNQVRDGLPRVAYRSADPDATGGPGRRHAIPMPPEIDLQNGDSPARFAIRYRPSRKPAAQLLPLALLWNLFMGFVVAVVPSFGNGWWFIAVFWVIGLGLAYFDLTLWLNSTFIRVSAADIRVRDEPLSLAGPMSIPIASLRQVFVDEQEIRDSRSGAISRNYRLWAIRTSGERTLLLNLPRPDLALYIERCIEDRLGIADEGVAGEYRSPF
jgi:hypothetical protein